MDTTEQYDPFTNSIRHSTPFTYPVEVVDEDPCHVELNDMLIKMSIYIIPSKDPRLTLITLFYAAGVDMSYILDCDQTETSIAKKLGVSKQKFSLAVQQVRKDFNLQHSITKQHNKTPDKYKNNYKRPTV